MTRILMPARRFDRLFANLLDTLFLLLPGMVIASLFAKTGADGELMMPPEGPAAMFLVNLAYYTMFTAGGWQATPGKRAMGIYVVRLDLKPLSQRDALERFLAFVIPTLPAYASFIPKDFIPVLVVWLSLFWFAPILTHPLRMGVHDKLCGTRVVEGRTAL